MTQPEIYEALNQHNPPAGEGLQYTYNFIRENMFSYSFIKLFQIVCTINLWHTIGDLKQIQLNQLGQMDNETLYTIIRFDPHQLKEGTTDAIAILLNDRQGLILGHHYNSDLNLLTIHHTILFV